MSLGPARTPTKYEDDSAVGMNRGEEYTEVGNGTTPSTLAQEQTTPASKLRRWSSGILDSAVRSILGCRSPMLSGGSVEADHQQQEESEYQNQTSPNGAIFSPKDQRKRRVPLSSMNNMASHSAVKASPAHDLITSSQRKSKKKRSSAAQGGERENVLPRTNLNKTLFTQDDEKTKNNNKHDEVEGTNANDDQANGKGQKRGGGGVLSNLLFSPMFTLLGPKLGSKFAPTKTTNNPLANTVDESEDEEEEEEREVDNGDDEMELEHAIAQDQAAADHFPATDLNCDEEGLRVSNEEESHPYGLENEDDDSEVEYEYSQSFDPFYFIKNLPPLEFCVPAYRKSLLPKQTRQTMRKKTLVLDLDETLVHSSLENEAPQFAEENQLKYNFTFPVHLGDERYDVFVYVRPGAIEFLEAMQEHFEVVIFTASQKMYAEKLLNILDPERRYIRHRLFRDSCVLVEGNYLKDLSIIGRDLKETIIVDNSPQAFAFQLSNGVPIESWFDDQQDKELLKLIPFLKKLSKAQVEDVRPSIVKRYKLHEKVANAG
jgi:CTD small phosphatase-like protein 2